MDKEMLLLEAARKSDERLQRQTERLQQLEQLCKLQHAVIVQIVKIQHDNELLADFAEEGRAEDAGQYFEFDETAFRRDLKAAQVQYKALQEQEVK